jgi:hypothetical protein
MNDEKPDQPDVTPSQSDDPVIRATDPSDDESPFEPHALDRLEEADLGEWDQE